MLRKNNYLQGLQDFNCGVFLQSLIICIILSVVKIATATTMKPVPATHVWRHEPINEGNIKLRSAVVVLYSFIGFQMNDSDIRYLI